MKTAALFLLGAAVAGALALALLPAARVVRVDIGAVSVYSEGDVRVVLPSSSVVGVSSSSVGSMGTTVPETGTKWVPPAWLGSPFARYILYAGGGALAVWALQLIKRRWGWQDKQMLNATVLVVGAIGLTITYLVQDKGISSLLSNPFNLGGGLGLTYLVSSLVYQYIVKR
jgi:hypothetical protein